MESPTEKGKTYRWDPKEEVIVEVIKVVEVPVEVKVKEYTGLYL